MENEAYILFGSEVKTREINSKEWIASGELIVFSSEKDPDASSLKDYFTPETDYDLDVSSRKRVCYNHGLPSKKDGKIIENPFGTKKIGIAECKVLSAAVWAESQMQIRDEYEEWVFEMARKGKLGWSSGAIAHLTQREKQQNGAHKITNWAIGEASLTPTPAEPRTLVNVKSLLDAVGDDDEDLDLDDIKSERDFERFLNEKFSHRESKALIAIAKRGFVARPQREVETATVAWANAQPDEAAIEAAKSAYLNTQARLSLSLSAQGV